MQQKREMGESVKHYTTRLNADKAAPAVTAGIILSQFLLPVQVALLSPAPLPSFPAMIGAESIQSKCDPSLELCTKHPERQHGL